VPYFPNLVRSQWRQTWPTAVSPLARAVAGGLAFVVLVGALLGHRTFVAVPHAAFPGAAVLLLGALAATATEHAWATRHSWLVSGGLVSTAALSLAGSCFVLLDLIQLVLTGTVNDRHGHSAWPAFTERLALVAAGALLAASATSWRRRTRGTCPRCGRSHAAGLVRATPPPPSPAPERVRRLAYAGCLAFVPYLLLHGLHAAGLVHRYDALYSDKGIIPGPRLLAFAFLTVVLVGPAVFLLMGLVRPWGLVFPRWCLGLAGRRVPRFLPVVPAWIVAPTLAMYGVGSIGYALVEGYSLIGLGGAASLAFGTYGCALATAAVSYQHRTRPVCTPK
jgi:hypothetical protein